MWAFIPVLPTLSPLVTSLYTHLCLRQTICFPGPFQKTSKGHSTEPGSETLSQKQISAGTTGRQNGRGRYLKKKMVVVTGHRSDATCVSVPIPMTSKVMTLSERKYSTSPWFIFEKANRFLKSNSGSVVSLRSVVLYESFSAHL